MSIFDEIRFLSDKDLVYKMFIGGSWVESSDKKTFDVLSPIDGSLVGKVQKATKKDAENAVEEAFKAKEKISNMAAIDRSEILRKASKILEKNKDEVIKTIVLEAGKPVKLAEGEVNASILRLEYASEEIKMMRGEFLKGDVVPKHKKRLGIIMRKPLGVILAITPFNYPLYTAVAKIAPAIAAGNSIVLKPASDDPICLLLFGKILEEAGIPKGVINIITGGGSEIGDYLISHEKVDMVSFTGSSAVGKHIASIAGMKKLQLELGGKCPAIVLEDCDIDLAVKECVKGSLEFSGQRCDAVSRILVVDSIADEFIKKVLDEVKKWKLGDPREPSTSLGPLINERAVEKVESLVKDALDKGAKLLRGGKRKDLYYEPTVLDNVTTEMRIAWEETFGPVITIIRVNSYEDAIKIANQSEYGLDSCIFTKNIDLAMDAAQKLESGAVHINAHPTHGLGEFPFGGVKSSGLGREGIKYSIENMTRIHTIVFHPKED